MAEATDLPPPTPEGLLIRRHRQSTQPRLSISRAAQLADVGVTTWGNTERGYRIDQDRNVFPYRPSEEILAHMAFALGLKPEDLVEVGRVDAAEVLAKMSGPEVDVVEVSTERGAVVIVPVPDDLPEEDREMVLRYAQQMAQDLHARRSPSDSN
jgi:hypothetical protein